jgi:hypothetical protein
MSKVPGPSSLHSKVAPVSELNSKSAIPSVVLPGPVSMVVFGAVVSTVNVLVAGVASVLLPTSVARTENV